MKLPENSHKRLNILTGEWVLVSPHRMNRPWQGKNEAPVKENLPSYSEQCYLCPGNSRANGISNPNYKSTHVFANDFAALQMGLPVENTDNELLVSSSEQGLCKVICYSPDHTKTMSKLSLTEIEAIIQTWKNEFEALSEIPNINHIQIFENKGEIMGCSNPHPHGQIWAQESIPNEALKKDKKQQEYHEQQGQNLLLNYLEKELTLNERVIYQNEQFVVLVPFWATWPFETMVVPKKHQTNITSLADNNNIYFAQALKVITMAYDKLFDTPFPYSMGIHQSPCNNENNKHWQWHVSFYPPSITFS